MGGGLMQLVAYGAQDIYLTGNPQITFFKVVYRRHTNFAMESVDQTLNGSAALGNKVTATVSRNGDLVGRMYLEIPVTLEGTIGSTPFTGVNPGHTVINEVEVQIGGQQIDKQWGHWMEVWAELTEPNDAGSMGLTSGGGTRFQNMALAGGVVQKTAAVGDDTQDVTATCRVPLQFWFNRNPGLALPLIALQYHEVKVMVTFASSVPGLSGIGQTQLWADYIYLDTDERRRFAQVSHEYLIEQVQHTSGSDSSLDLNFNHPVKELVWTGAYTATSGVRAAFNSNSKFKLVLNGHDRFAERPLQYFTQTQVWQHHTGTPVQCDNHSLTVSDPQVDADQNANVASTGKASVDEIAVYSFALKPEEHQPSGTCNFSRIDNAQLKNSGTANANANVYAINYNVLRVMSGMGGLAYSN
jgi:hypothetical protein